MVVDREKQEKETIILAMKEREIYAVSPRCAGAPLIHLGAVLRLENDGGQRGPEATLQMPAFLYVVQAQKRTAFVVGPFRTLTPDVFALATGWRTAACDVGMLRPG